MSEAGKKTTAGRVTVDRPTAEKEYERLCESWKIKKSSSESGSSDAVIEAIQDGTVIIQNDKGEGYRLTILQKLDEKVGDFSEITYRFPLASDMMQMDNYKADQQFKKAAAMIGSVTGIGQLVHRMGGPDFMLGQAIAFVFLGV